MRELNTTNKETGKMDAFQHIEMRVEKAEKELKDLKDGIRNLKTYDADYEDGDLVDKFKGLFGADFRGDYVDVLDLDLLLEGDK